jgi:hypothetical protein
MGFVEALDRVESAVHELVEGRFFRDLIAERISAFSDPSSQFPVGFSPAIASRSFAILPMIVAVEDSPTGPQADSKLRLAHSTGLQAHSGGSNRRRDTARNPLTAGRIAP